MPRGRDVYQEAVDKWGEASQVDMAIEEMAELILALQHFKRGRVGVEAIVTEVADVRIMMRQLSRILPPASVYAEESRKLQRLERHLDGIEDAKMGDANGG